VADKSNNELNSTTAKTATDTIRNHIFPDQTPDMAEKIYWESLRKAIRSGTANYLAARGNTQYKGSKQKAEKAKAGFLHGKKGLKKATHLHAQLEKLEAQESDFNEKEKKIIILASLTLIASSTWLAGCVFESRKEKGILSETMFNQQAHQAMSGSEMITLDNSPSDKIRTTLSDLTLRANIKKEEIDAKIKLFCSSKLNKKRTTDVDALDDFPREIYRI